MATRDTFLDENDPLGPILTDPNRWRVYQDRQATREPISGSPAIPGSSYSDSRIDQLMRFYDQDRRSRGLGDAASILGAVAEGERAGRTRTGDRELTYDQIMINRENEKNRLLSERQGEQNRLNLLSVQDRRASETDAFKKIQDAGFILRGGASQYQSPAMTIRGKSSQLPGLNRPAPSASETAAATTLNEQMLARLQPGTGWKPDFTWEPEFNYTPRPFDERDAGPS